MKYCNIKVNKLHVLDFNPLTKFHSIFHRLDIPVVVGYLIGGKCCEIIEVGRNLMVTKYYFLHFDIDDIFRALR
jgi:hypothetical protein